MSSKILLNLVNTLDVILLTAVLGFAVWRKVYRTLPFFVALLSVGLLHQSLCVVLMFHRHATGLTKDQAYPLYLATEWVGQAAETALTLLCVFSAYQELMKPLQGLHRLGRLVFRWIGGMSLVFAVAMSLAPHTGGYSFLGTLIGQVEEGIGILTLCLLLFVCFSTRPLGLSYRSHAFGLTLGLGVAATASLVQAAWLPTHFSGNMYSPVFLISGFGALVTMLVWAAYLAHPEPKRRMLLLPTTSPFHTWNRIAEALGDAPGKVVVGGITPEMFAPAELMAFRVPLRAPAPVVEIPQAVQR